jgi:transcriptional regulator with XRE-family HTH domain
VTVSGAALKEMRTALGLTLTEVAVELGISAPAVAAAERSVRVRPETEVRYFLAYSELARRQAVERQRAMTETVLARAQL